MSESLTTENLARRLTSLAQKAASSTTCASSSESGSGIRCGSLPEATEMEPGSDARAACIRIRHLTGHFAHRFDEVFDRPRGRADRRIDRIDRRTCHEDRGFGHPDWAGGV